MQSQACGAWLQGFAERKILLLQIAITCCKARHAEAVRKVRQRKRKQKQTGQGMLHEAKLAQVLSPTSYHTVLARLAALCISDPLGCDGAHLCRPLGKSSKRDQQICAQPPRRG